MRYFLIGVLLLFSNSCYGDTSGFGGLAVKVLDKKLKPLHQSVVSLKPLSGQDVSSYQSYTTIMEQKDRLFHPFILAVRKGAEVNFPNRDPFRHHVYSFSKTKKFELRLYGQDEDKKVIFDQTGVAALGCNIHDNMLAFIYVTDDPIFKKTNKEGMVVFKNLPVGEYQITYWHVDQKKKQKKILSKITIVPDQVVDIQSQLFVRSRKQQQHSATDGGDY